jgi:hypothetical protein
LFISEHLNAKNLLLIRVYQILIGSVYCNITLGKICRTEPYFFTDNIKKDIFAKKYIKKDKTSLVVVIDRKE